MLHEYQALPAGLLDLSAAELHTALGGPSLIHLPGRRQPALFVCVLMHGNETTGWDAVRELIRGYVEGGRELPRALSLFIGNTAAAAAGVRHLPEQADYNRVWPGSETQGTPEHAMMHAAVECMADREVFASVDLHNNTGMNPHYACVNVLEHQALHLATLFSRTVVYFVRPRGVASMALAALAPAVTLECGKVGPGHALTHTIEYLDACLHLAELPSHPVPAHDIDLFHTVAVVRVLPEIDFGFAEPDAEIDFPSDLDRLNFRELPTGTLFGVVRGHGEPPLEVCDEADCSVVGRYFEVCDGELLTRRPLMPSMLTCAKDVIRQDCLCYLMERYDDHLQQAG